MLEMEGAGPDEEMPSTNVAELADVIEGALSVRIQGSLVELIEGIGYRHRTSRIRSEHSWCKA